MSLDLAFTQTMQNSSPQEAWQAIFAKAWQICSQPLPAHAGSEVTKRDRHIADIDYYLSTGGWDLWQHYEEAATQTSAKLLEWWNAQSSGKAVLILDALSLRELPWILAEAESRGFTISQAQATGAELPADTTSFAKALGFSQRSALGNNSAGGSHKFNGAKTESTDIAWQDCGDLIDSHPDWFFWHHWPDHVLHAHDDPGKGINTLTEDAQKHLTSDDFWSFVERLATGRKVVITADHGYAASGLFPDSNKQQTEHLKKTYKSGRFISSQEQTGAFVPPIDLKIQSLHGEYTFVNGRRKWKSAGGYPTLTHGGLSILEVAVPFIDISKN